ncbi:MAG TPA: DUF6492 family protein [Actinophytocola sp.]|uniref:DUF6492 family protein n=1 Tax=Actinophytocola sp. TaxID=1872138 RepID=UPI002DDC9A76|nr:DUF6492 family protein [Actinophytocola sp.]HEV2779863.1 DUF6492 family protein [Actinophytocola sp.]
MTELAVVTPSFGPDAELFADLHRSVLRHTGPQVVHHAIVPDSDLSLFAGFSGPRCRVWTESELLPRRYVKLPRSGLRVNLRRPWPPVRGWVLQQAIKLAVAERLDADVVLIADSDVVLVRDISAATFTTDGRLRLYRLPGAVHDGMADHVRWHQVARRLLGLPPAPPPPLPDYVSSLNVWSPAVVRAIQRRITEVTGRHWMDVCTAQLQISEFIIYGVFVDEILAGPGSVWPGDTTICHNYWDTTPLDTAAALAFADGLGAEAVGMMISAKSGTPHDVRQAAIRRCAEVAGGAIA